MYSVKIVKMKSLARSFVLAGAVAGALIGFGPNVGVAQEVKPDAVLAKVGDLVVTEQDLEFAQADMAQQFARVPEEQRKAAVLSALIDIKLLSLLAAKEGVAESAAFKTRMEFLRARTLHNAYFQEKIASSVTDDEVKARFEVEIKGVTPQKQISARHILLKTEEEALAVVKELQGGKDFVEVAKEKSTGPSGPNGGDLGFFGKGQMVPEFEAAAFALEKGGITDTPVKTQFGFHVIKKEDERDEPLPTFEESKTQIRQILLQEKYLASIATAKESAAVEVMDEALKAQIDIIKQPK